MVRVKRRYVLVSVRFLSETASLTSGSICHSIRDVVEQLYGDFGIACLLRAFSIKRLDQDSGHGIIATRKGTHAIVMAAIPLVTSINRQPCAIDILHLSGTIKGCLKESKKHHLKFIRKSLSQKMKNEKLEQLLQLN